ncbi:galactosyltransferase-related protein [Campylobacter lari]|nr:MULTISPECIES: galactosyltransferase-related protein [Campylobacter]EAH4935809.1 glycosyltransferase [Campylobacter lari]EAH8151916.1 glycosyltransferase [Campylobacter lari]EAI3905791.1 glycosyltransferase [Campylobacter lari]EAI3912519.1 glycosyltransferase [Campylobacter lari]EAI4448286.1 glycosyltransferase [Campylobacter lari]
MKLSIVIPFGLSKERIYIKDRVIQKACEFKSDDRVEYIFVEGYSSLENDLKRVIEENGHIYLKDESQKDFFSQGKCRNLGASFANSDVVMFLDVDYYLSQQSLEYILDLINVKEIALKPNHILSLPVVFLNQKGSEFIENQDKKIWDGLIKNDLISGKKEWIKFFAPSSTSSIVINRHKFLTLGGNDERFIGHGYEDFDLLARILYSCIDLEQIPANLNYDARNWNFKNFEGFRAWFALLGYEASFHGVYLYHFHHDEPNQNGYMDNKHKNHQRFYKHISNIKSHSIKHLCDKSVYRDNVLFIHSKEILYSIKEILPYIGNIIYINEDNLIYKSQKELESIITEKQIHKVLLLNECIKNENLLDFFQKLDLDIVYFEKGILPESYLITSNKNKMLEFDKTLYQDEITQARLYLKSLSKEDNDKILNFMVEKNIDKNDLDFFVNFLINVLYCFGKKEQEIIKFYKINLENKKIFFKDIQKSKYSLNSLIYKPFIYEISSFSFMKIFNKYIGLKLIQTKFSHTKFYRLFQKFFYNPKAFFDDSKFFKKFKNAN